MELGPLYQSLCLDVGCNDGKLTAEIAKICSPRMIVGIDTDAQLIENATMLGKRLVFGHEKGNVEQLKEGHLISNRNFPPISSQMSLIPRSFNLKKSNSSLILGDNSNAQVFPYNFKFLCKDVFQLASSSIYDNVICFSVVKWVHLNEGDTGLIRFFHRLYSLLKPNGSLFLEFQPWKSYISNRATSETTKSIFPTIQIRPENFHDLLTQDIGFLFERNIGTDLKDAKGYDRPIYWLRKPQIVSSIIVQEATLIADSSVKIDVKESHLSPVNVFKPPKHGIETASDESLPYTESKSEKKKRKRDSKK